MFVSFTKTDFENFALALTSITPAQRRGFRADCALPFNYFFDNTLSRTLISSKLVLLIERVGGSVRNLYGFAGVV